MDNPLDKDCRIDKWGELLKILILLNRIDLFHINKEGTEVIIDVDGITYYINFKSQENIICIYRDMKINDIIKN